MRLIGLVTVGIALAATLVAPFVPGAAELGAPVPPASLTRTLTFQTGRLGLSVERAEPGSPLGPLFYTTAVEGMGPDGLPGQLPTGLWAPGDRFERRLTVRNVGSLPVQLAGVAVVNLTGSALADVAKVQVWLGPALLTWGTVKELAKLPHLFIGGPQELQPGASISLLVVASLDRSVGNAYQGKQLRFDLQVLGEQVGAPRQEPPPGSEQLG
ncbi:MAG TPA: hypothetical protein VK191_15705 [Symbiobacteriaceae bacterium]|nr:hypothetical protein [Symbiobacteriaceae bacterium]